MIPAGGMGSLHWGGKHKTWKIEKHAAAGEISDRTHTVSEK